MTRISSTIFALSFALLLTAAAANAQSQRTFVSTAGDDANTASLCSAANPCRSFGAALTVTNTNGEIIALTSGGYGAVTINKGVQITAPTGVYAAITASSSDAITVSAAGAVVVLRGLTLNSQGATFGINATAVGALHIEGCIVNGFSGDGIKVALTADSSEIFIKDTIVRNNAGAGIAITTTTGTVTASINGCRAENNSSDGFSALLRARVTMSNSVAAGNGNTGFIAYNTVSGATAEMNVEHCVASSNISFGFSTQGGGGGTATMRVARSAATNNGGGFFQATGGTFRSLGDNLVDGNGTDTFGTITVISGR